MVPKTTVANYERKEHRYYRETRPEMMAFIPETARMILDVGCSEGHFGHALKLRQPCEIWGVEMMPNAAAVAKENLDHVLVAPFNNELPLPEKHFDCVIFNDCLEHLENPENALALAKCLLKPAGLVVASIPNLRYYPVMRDLLLHGKWEYADSGTLDRTHLRFFTQSSIRRMFEQTDFTVMSLQGINPDLWGKSWKFQFLHTLLPGKVDDMRYQQFAVVAQCRQ